MRFNIYFLSIDKNKDTYFRVCWRLVYVESFKSKQFPSEKKFSLSNALKTLERSFSIGSIHETTPLAGISIFCAEKSNVFYQNLKENIKWQNAKSQNNGVKYPFSVEIMS